MTTFDQRGQTVDTQYNAERIVINQSGDLKAEFFRRSRQQMLRKVRAMWIDGFLEPSLRWGTIAPFIEERRDLVVSPFDDLAQRPRTVGGTPGLQLDPYDVFERSGHGLLILGAPGAGKTTFLLQLARSLLNRAAQDDGVVIPVVFNLSSWSASRRSLAEWLVTELDVRYDIPTTLAREWIRYNALLPLLDGLDEVDAHRSDACVESINQFVRGHGLVPLAVCSRLADYQRLSTRLRLPNAVVIQPIDKWQTIEILERSGVRWPGLQQLLDEDEAMHELLSTPFMLSIAAHASDGVGSDKTGTNVDAVQERLLSAYVDAVFERRSATGAYTFTKAQTWLGWLASSMRRHNLTLITVDWMQPAWLNRRSLERLVTMTTTLITALAVWSFATACAALLPFRFMTPSAALQGLPSAVLDGILFSGLFAVIVSIRRRFPACVAGALVAAGLAMISEQLFGAVIVAAVIVSPNFGFDNLLAAFLTNPWTGLVLSNQDALTRVLLFGSLGGLLSAMGVTFIRATDEIKPIEQLRWSIHRAGSVSRRRVLTAAARGLAVVGELALVLALLFALPDIVAAERGIIMPGFGRVAQHPLDLAAGEAWLLIRRMLAFGAAAGPILGAVFAVLNAGWIEDVSAASYPYQRLRRSFRNACVMGAAFGTITYGLSVYFLGRSYASYPSTFVSVLSWLRFGGRPCLQHVGLLLVIRFKNLGPLNYRKFLDMLTARTLMRRTGSGYAFSHRMLRNLLATRCDAANRKVRTTTR